MSQPSTNDMQPLKNFASKQPRKVSATLSSSVALSVPGSGGGVWDPPVKRGFVYIDDGVVYQRKKKKDNLGVLVTVKSNKKRKMK